MKTLNRQVALATFGLLLTHLFHASAAPRVPLPPLPELVPVLHRFRFDEPCLLSTNHLPSVATDYGTAVESFSGYALERAGESVAPFLVPALDGIGRANVACGNGAIRFWFNARAQSGSACLVEMIVLRNHSAAVNFSLHVNEDGSAICLDGATGDGADGPLEAEETSSLPATLNL
jgi:hypothetical protein